MQIPFLIIFQLILCLIFCHQTCIHFVKGVESRRSALYQPSWKFQLSKFICELKIYLIPLTVLGFFSCLVPFDFIVWVFYIGSVEGQYGSADHWLCFVKTCSLVMSNASVTKQELEILFKR